MRSGALLLISMVMGMSASAQAGEKLVADICGGVNAGKPYKAIKRFERNSKKISASDVTARSCYADALNRIGDHAKAERVCRKTDLPLTSPGTGPLYLQWGIALNGLARYDSAEILLWAAARAGVADRTDLPLAAALQGRRRWSDAIAILDRVVAHDTANARAFRERGACHAEMGDSASARRDLDHAIDLAPRDPVSWNSRGFHRWATFGDHARAIKDYDRAIKLNPNYSYVFNNRGWSWYKLGEKEKAMRDIELAGRKKANNPMVSRNLGIIALDGGDGGKACSYFKRALDEGFTAQFGTEVEALMLEHCGALPTTPRKAPPPSNAPGSSPMKSNAP